MPQYGALINNLSRDDSDGPIHHGLVSCINPVATELVVVQTVPAPLAWCFVAQSRRASWERFHRVRCSSSDLTSGEPILTNYFPLDTGVLLVAFDQVSISLINPSRAA